MMAAGASGKDIVIIILFALLLFVLVTSPGATPPATVTQPALPPSQAENGPTFVKIANTEPKVERAVVRILGASQIAGTLQNSVTPQLDDLDHNVLSLPICVMGQEISVWAPGYYIKTEPCDGAKGSYDVTLEPVNENDNATNYIWTGASRYASNGQIDCGICHPGIVQDWLKGGHSKALIHPYFWTMYLGVDFNWRQSQQIKWDILEDGQKIYPLLDPFQPNYGPGYQLDYPVSNGNCVFCHVPAAHAGTRQEMDLSALIHNSRGAHIDAVTEGVTCDVCHKITGVLVGKNQLPYDDRPGVLSMSILRPNLAAQVNTGPLAYQSIPDKDFLNIDPNALNSKRTCYPVFSESEFCAPCHYGKFANTQIYGAYKEWLESPYRDKYIRSADGQPVSENPNYRSCQDCHMLGQAQIANTLPSERDACSGSIARFTISHNMMNYGEDSENPTRQIPRLVQNAAQINLEARLEEGQIKLKVNVTNTGAGHKFPTDSPLRHLILLLEARDWREIPLTQTAGPKVPVWAVPDHAGYAGEIYANILKDKDTNLAPTFAYWNPVENAWQGSDTRLIPGVPVQSDYAFAAPYDRTARITATLIYRRAFMNVVYQKGWYMGDLDVKVTQSVLDCSGFGVPPENMVCVSVTPTPTP